MQDLKAVLDVLKFMVVKTQFYPEEGGSMLLQCWYMYSCLQDGKYSSAQIHFKSFNFLTENGRFWSAFSVAFRNTFYCCILKYILLLHFEARFTFHFEAHFTVAFRSKFCSCILKYILLLYFEAQFTVAFRSRFYCCISKQILLLHFEVHFTVTIWSTIYFCISKDILLLHF